MGKEINTGLKFYLRWSYNEPKHPTKTMSKFTWETGIDMTILGPKLKFDENTTLTQWRKLEIDKWENLMKDFKKDKKVQSLDFEIIPNEDKIKEVESDVDFIKWID